MSLHCSFCNLPQEVLDKLIVGNDNVSICDRCIATCNLVIEEGKIAVQKRGIQEYDSWSSSQSAALDESTKEKP